MLDQKGLNPSFWEDEIKVTAVVWNELCGPGYFCFSDRGETDYPPLTLYFRELKLCFRKNTLTSFPILCHATCFCLSESAYVYKFVQCSYAYISSRLASSLAAAISHKGGMGLLVYIYALLRAEFSSCWVTPKFVWKQKMYLVSCYLDILQAKFFEQIY